MANDIKGFTLSISKSRMLTMARRNAVEAGSLRSARHKNKKVNWRDDELSPPVTTPLTTGLISPRLVYMKTSNFQGSFDVSVTRQLVTHDLRDRSCESYGAQLRSTRPRRLRPDFTISFGFRQKENHF